MAIEKENYSDVIDAYESGVGVLEGESLTDYIKRNNIKIKEIDMDDMDSESGIRSLDRGAPSIKMASETPEEEFDMMMDMELKQEFDEFQKNNPGKTFDDFLDIKVIQMSEGPDDTETILKLMEDNNMSFEEASNYLRIEKSRKNKPREPEKPKTIKAAGGGLAYLMGM